MLLGMFHAARCGEFAATDPTLRHLLRRATTPLRAVLAGIAR
jgi:NAD(P)H dehydrogenase (quinone)